MEEHEKLKVSSTLKTEKLKVSISGENREKLKVFSTGPKSAFFLKCKSTKITIHLKNTTVNRYSLQIAKIFYTEFVAKRVCIETKIIWLLQKYSNKFIFF